ncbi:MULTISPECIES: hypothetical protein [Thermoactinomyces]|uniref:Uncharacterized protein n=1 Tax=Thermoactinomyces daqus TaxID=1329516 RepID=A0A7W2AHJ2_9BACL|nr:MULTISPECIES: hypothetical protein [Thermoactinomyces]MBA4542220.1 hypothetical protein [Thermoactinomyces daqus]MBH8598328.1 hypothetical protein [Thermoactinomyces sp. CICC 10523]MBH8604452.1 hypothetical protein [Thermoactinomyces sp. CICC 10522]MBH8607548.1 hypothetical protein [Thermoactinomyces sp. CICC 10521]
MQLWHMRCLNIRYGDGVSVVVRARESLVHGEGRQPAAFNAGRRKEREAPGKSGVLR